LIVSSAKIYIDNQIRLPGGAAAAADTGVVFFYDRTSAKSDQEPPGTTWADAGGSILFPAKMAKLAFFTQTPRDPVLLYYLVFLPFPPLMHLYFL
jgi:hypothetical protein